MQETEFTIKYGHVTDMEKNFHNKINKQVIAFNIFKANNPFNPLNPKPKLFLKIGNYDIFYPYAVK